jgi:hypothetical protein
MSTNINWGVNTAFAVFYGLLFGSIGTIFGTFTSVGGGLFVVFIIYTAVQITYIIMDNYRDKKEEPT